MHFPKAVKEKCFAEFNIDGTGFITFKNLCLVLARVLFAETEEFFAFLFRILDNDGDGILKSSEITNFLIACSMALN